jgi:hypothetical protein
MNKIKKKSLILIGLLVLFIIGISLNKPTNIGPEIPVQLNTPENSQFQFSNGTLNVSQSFQMLEIAENNGTERNVSSFNIDLGTSRWNVSELELDINNMTFTNETKTIEDTEEGERDLNGNVRKMFAVQIKIPAFTRIYQIRIYAKNISDSKLKAPIYLQINGYDSQENEPNSTIYGEQIELNVTGGSDWYIHKYSDPVNLTKGDYTLILNGTQMNNDDNEKYFWKYNDSNPKYPDLYRWVYRNDWQTAIQGVFLYKLDQQIIEDFYPTEINMTAEINGKHYAIEDKDDKNTGNLSFSENFFPNSTSLNIPFKNNLSDALIVNISYNIELNHILPCSGSVFINKSQDNLWTINSNFVRFGYNYTVVYNYPDHWTITNVYNNSGVVPFDSGINDTGDLLYIYNKTISDDGPWKIEATSITYNLTIDPDSGNTFKGGVLLEFWMRDLPIGGNYTFILVDANGSEVFNDTKIEPTGEFTFNYSLPSNATKGNWTAYVYWNNNTDAGMQNQSFVIIDGDPPLWVPTPSNRTIPYETAFAYNVSAHDEQSLIDSFWLSDEENFSISSIIGLPGRDAIAEITNNSILSLGEHLLTINVNDTEGNTNTTSIKITVENETGPVWSPQPENQSVEFGYNFSYQVSAWDLTGMDQFWLSDEGNFTISSIIGVPGHNATAEITNNTILAQNGEYWLTIYVNDTKNYTSNATIKVTVENQSAPVWTPEPENREIEFGDDFSYQVNAWDLSGIDQFWLSDEGNFSIVIIDDLIQNATAEITNNTELQVRVYSVNISVSDPLGNINTSVINITVHAPAPPTWNPQPEEILTITVGSFFSYQVHAEDFSGIDQYSLNDTSFFQINPETGIIINSKALPVGDYWLKVFVNDTLGNTNNATLQIIVFETAPSLLLPPEETSEGINPLLLTIIFVVIGGVAGITVSSYYVISKIRKDRQVYRSKLKNKAMDILNLKDIIVIAKDSGLNVYEEHYSGRAIDATLVSGFLDAIRSFGVEITGTRQETQIFSLEYKKSIVIMVEFKSFRLILIMSDKPSQEFLNSVEELSFEIEEKYGEKIQKFSYDIKEFVGMHDLIQKHLNTAFVSPLRINEPEAVELTPTESSIIKKAKKIMKLNSLDYIFTSFLFPEEEIETEQIEAIFNLIEKNILQPTKLESKKE